MNLFKIGIKNWITEVLRPNDWLYYYSSVTLDQLVSKASEYIKGIKAARTFANNHNLSSEFEQQLEEWLKEVVGVMPVEYNMKCYNLWFGTREIAKAFSLLGSFNELLDSRLKSLGTPIVDTEGKPNEARTLAKWRKKLNSTDADEHEPYKSSDNENG